MSENDMNEQSGQQPGNPSDATRPPASDPNAAGGPEHAEHEAWRPPSETGPDATPPPAAMPPASMPAPVPPIPMPPAPGAPVTPAAAPPTASSGSPEPTVPVSGPAGPPVSGAAPAPQHPWAPAPYPAGGYPVSGDYPTTGQPTIGQPTTGQPAAPPQTYPVAATATGFPTPGGYPTSAYPSYAGGYPPPPPPREPKKRFGGGALAGFAGLALILALGGGLAGGAIMHQIDKNDRVTVSGSGVVVDNAPIVDRSSLASIASKVSPSVVSITTQNAEGSGVVLSADGYILTNNHVAATASGQSVDVTFTNGNTVKATLVGTDAKTDLAVFKAENASGLTVATFGDSAKLQVGDTVLAIGSPLGLDGSVTAGIVSALNRTIDESPDSGQPQDPFSQNQNQDSSPTATIAGAIQTDAAINPGNSGGALVNTNGEVVGINTAIATNGADGNIGVGFAIPSNRAKQVADDIIKGVAVSHPQLGVSVSTANDNAGALVASVTTGSAADKAGIKAGDVITSFNGQPVHTSDDLLNAVQSGTVGKSVPMTVVRGGATQTLNVTLGEAK